jgi:hypothetical protein
MVNEHVEVLQLSRFGYDSVGVTAFPDSPDDKVSPWQQFLLGPHFSCLRYMGYVLRKHYRFATEDPCSTFPKFQAVSLQSTSVSMFFPCGEPLWVFNCASVGETPAVEI